MTSVLKKDQKKIMKSQKNPKFSLKNLVFLSIYGFFFNQIKEYLSPTPPSQSVFSHKIQPKQFS